MSRLHDSASDRYESNELIVALQYLDEVQYRLRALGIGTNQPQVSAALGLARVQLEPIPGESRSEYRDPEAEASAPQSAAIFNIDAIVRELRAEFSGRYGKWTPTIGKNRLIGHVGNHSVAEITGAGEVTFGGSGVPVNSSPQALLPRGTGPGRGARVGVADTRLVPQPWASGGWVARYSDRVPLASPTPAIAGHATFITGLVLFQAPGATVEVRRLLDDDGLANSWAAANRIVEFAGSGIDVLCLSFACYTDDGRPPLALATAIGRLDPGIVVVAAAGNHAHMAEPRTLPPAWPAALDDVIAVGAATDDSGEAADFSPSAPWVDVLAVGVGVTSTYLDGRVSVPVDPDQPTGGTVEQQFGGFATWDGTSFAAASVTGAIAAGVVPGQVTARESWENIQTTLRGSPGGRGQDGQAPFLPLVLPH